MSNLSVAPLARGRRSGQSLIELAITVPLLATLCLGVSDFARVFYGAIELNTAARAGAQYGSQSVITASDSAGMIAAAKLDAPDLAGITATAVQCTCNAPSVVTTCLASYCAKNPFATFVTVTTQIPFKTILTYPGIPSRLTLGGKAVMAVGQ